MRAINHHLFVRISVAACVLVIAAAVVGCSSSSDEDKAGVETRDKPVELVLANHDDSSEAVGAWADAVEKLSDGSIRIRVSNSWRQGESNYEQATLRDVGRGNVALAIVAARAYDEVGVTSFQPLVAPMLIDSRELERRVLRDDVADRALAGTQKLGLTGLAVLPMELRRPVGLTRALTAPEHFAGASVYTREGKTARATFEALGARPVHLPIEQWHTVDGAEVGLPALRGQRQLARGGAQITANVVLWPQPMTIVMNQDAFDQLSESQQTALRDAVEQAFDRESQLVSDARRRGSRRPVPYRHAVRRRHTVPGGRSAYGRGARLSDDRARRRATQTRSRASASSRATPSPRPSRARRNRPRPLTRTKPRQSSKAPTAQASPRSSSPTRRSSRTKPRSTTRTGASSRCSSRTGGSASPSTTTEPSSQRRAATQPAPTSSSCTSTNSARPGATGGRSTAAR